MNNPSLLIVDDEEDFVSTMMKRLRRRSVPCQAAHNGSAAIDSVRKGNFDAVLLDMGLPDMDGNSVLREIKRIKPEIRVLILTGQASVVTGEKGLAEGAAEYLLKPVEFENLLAKLLAGNEEQARGSPEPS
ncbi:MAG: response regulator [Desulfobacterales bacterium]|nr:response regulator [Desulfobacterales bacterium]